MTRFDFTITIGSSAETPKEAWLKAIAELAMNPGPMQDEYLESEDMHQIKESDVLARLGAAIDGLGLAGLAHLHNSLTDYESITCNNIEPTEGWHLIPKEGSH